MPKTEVKSELFQKLGNQLKSAHEAHKNDETEYGGGFAELPAGLNGAIAQLIECKFDKFKTGKLQGEYYFMARGVIVSPKEFNGQYIEGLNTQIGPEPICNTPDRVRKTVDEHVAWIYNELRKLGLDTSTIEPENLQLACEELKNAAPYFRFRTWKGQKQEVVRKNGKFYVGQKVYDTEEAATKANPFVNQEPRVNHDWDRAIEWSGGGESSGSDFNDSSPKTDERKEPKSNGKPKTESRRAPEPEPTNDEPDLDKLSADAEMGDDDARKEIHRLAMEAGMSEDEFNNIDKWSDMADAIRNFGQNGEQSGDDDEDKNDENNEFKPIKGKMYKFKPIDAATKKPQKKSVEVEVIKVDETKSTVDLKRMDTKQLIRGVAWSDIEQ